MMVLRSEQVEIIDDWHVMGMTAIFPAKFILRKEQLFTEEDRAYVTSFSASLPYALKTCSDMAKQLPLNLPPVVTLIWRRYRLGLPRIWIAWNDRGRACNRDLGSI
ncbi:hypothetical protein [Agrobacterium vitis]|uniref:hypothetical protein n=1 Tax=Agrobacterium vitis TaxID=373 RepID=UPI00157309A6|nr:hypothetical protein [Agrobacterium vitis]NSZ16632.1 hypothetical protein [Agrobacterium vitis]QZO05392.1 hypothetical protein K4831_07755 [Agrobacterium vitis]UJL87538.1 hypothetical protein AVF2S5_06095 [Agrobacterium vitis]